MVRTTVNPQNAPVQPSYDLTAGDDERIGHHDAPVVVILTFVFPLIAQGLAERWFNFVEQYAGDASVIIGGRSIPFLLMIVGFFPTSISLVIALETFVGEKERRSLEPLLSTPLTNTEMYIGKTMSSIIPPLIASYGGMTFYLLMLVNGELEWRPQPALIAQIFLLTTVQSLVMITGAVVVSSQATSTRSANLLASFVIIPMTVVIQAESFVMFIAPDADSPYGIMSLWLTAIAMMVVVVLFLRVGNSIFNREELLGRTIDQLNIRNIARRMWRNILAVDHDLTPATSLGQWYRQGVWGAVKRSRSAIILTTIYFVFVTAAGVWYGFYGELQFTIPDVDAVDNSAALSTLLDNNIQGEAMRFIIWNNTRILTLALVAGAFSFGIAALLLTPAVFGLLGYLLVIIMRSSLPIEIFFAGIFVHGIVEIPVIVLATAVAFRLGAVVTKPPEGKTVGMAWMNTFGDVMKVFIGVVLPGLVLAAAIEAYITPRVVIALLSGGV